MTVNRQAIISKLREQIEILSEQLFTVRAELIQLKRQDEWEEVHRNLGRCFKVDEMVDTEDGIQRRIAYYQITAISLWNTSFMIEYWPEEEELKVGSALGYPWLKEHSQELSTDDYYSEVRDLLRKVFPFNIVAIAKRKI